MDAKSYNEFCACLKSYLQCVAKLLWLQCSRLVATVRENFIPEAGSSGIRALGSRFVNLWGCGGYGKAAEVVWRRECPIIALRAEVSAIQLLQVS